MLYRWWLLVKDFWLNHDKHAFVEHHILYFALVFGGGAILVLLFLMNYKIKKQLNKMELESRRRKVKMMRDTSKETQKELQKKKKLTFDEE